MKNTLLMMATVLLFSSCAKEEFSANKGTQKTNLNALESASNKLCSQSTLISPQVDILMLWDNTSSFNFVNDATKTSMTKLISSVSENFDYHILSMPLVSTNPSNPLNEGQLVVKNNTGLSGGALGIVKTKENAVSSLGFSQGTGAAESGINRAIEVLQANRSNGIFRNGAYTMIVVISNEDDKGCELSTGYNKCSQGGMNTYVDPKINTLLCLRGFTTNRNCSGINPLNSAMMRFINISPLTVGIGTSCTNTSVYPYANYIYRRAAKAIYEESYSNDWPTSNDHIGPDLSGYPDSYNICKYGFDYAHIFDGVNTAIKQTLLKHKYDYWPVAGATTSVDPATLQVTRSDGKVLTNRTGESNPTDGFIYVGNQTARNTRFYPTAGEPFNGKMIQLLGVDGNDKIVYPDCLTVSYKAEKSTYGYIYLTKGEPSLSTIKVMINNAVVPQSASNGWDYMGLQSTAGLDPNLQIANMPSNVSSGYFLRLNGTYKIQNTSANTIYVEYISKSQ